MTSHNAANTRHKRAETLRVEAPAASAGERLTRAQSRRRMIFRALHDCIIENGYSKTTLAHIASKADMTPSHLLYYFQGKESILEEYFANVAKRFLRRIATINEAPAEERVSLLTGLWFGESETAYADIGFMLECFGEAVHDGTMRETKSNFDRSCKQYLEQIFPKAILRDSMNEKDAAEITYSLLIGLRNSVYFDESLTLADAARYFETAISNLQKEP